MRREYDPKTQETTTGLQRLGSRMQRIPGMRDLGTFVAKQGVTVSRKRPEDIEKHRKENLEALTNEGIVARARGRTAFVDPTTSAAIGQELARRNLTDPQELIRQGLISNTGEAPDMRRFVEVAERMGNAQSIYNNRPDMVQPRPDIVDPVTGASRAETAEEAIARVVRNISVSDVTQLDHRELGDFANPAAQPSNEQVNITLNLSNPQLGKIGTEGSAQQVEAIRNSASYLMTAPGALDGFTQQQIDNLDRIMDYIDNNPNWQSL